MPPKTSNASNVDKIVGGIMERFRPLLREAVEKVDADTRAEMVTRFSQALGTTKPAAETPVKRKVGRPRKNPPTPETAAAAPASADKPKRKAKAKRVVSDEVRQKLAENLKKARDAKADKVVPEKRKVGRPRKVVPATTAVAEQA